MENRNQTKNIVLFMRLPALQKEVFIRRSPNRCLTIVRDGTKHLSGLSVSSTENSRILLFPQWGRQTFCAARSCISDYCGEASCLPNSIKSTFRASPSIYMSFVFSKWHILVSSQKSCRKIDFPDSPFLYLIFEANRYCRRRESNPHGVAPGGFWVRCVYQFHHFGF